MFERSVPYYDALYSFVDYQNGAEQLRRLIAEARPDARTLLDVACGTGRHLEHLRRWFDCSGIDVSPEMAAIAQRRCPDVDVHVGDMVAFDLDRRFDVITCLFSSIGYVRTVAALDRAIANFAQHLSPGGLVVVEPWFDQEQYWRDRVTLNTVDEGNRKIAWMYTSAADEAVSVLDIHFLVGTAEGVEHFTERHELGLFTLNDYEDAFHQSGLSLTHQAGGPSGRGLYLGATQ